ncbi:ABC transporter permease [Paenisporosarcina indica]|uniref:lmo0954 family membrane protein n=1 Tax=Paenisporosarcina indica TaxID=650093 RepID=UPI00094F61A3|nr:ABC transporter permease [Paenisporosarcina indica]
MKKFGLIVLGSIAGIVALANLGSMLGLALSALLVYAGMHYYLKGGSTFRKILWVGVGIFGLLTAIANVPGFFGILAIAGLWIVIRKWKQQPLVMTSSSNASSSDPFTNFEKQWNELNNN